MSPSGQDSLPLLASDRHTFAEWLGEEPAEYIDEYGAPCAGFSGAWLTGPRGSGKSHLLHAAAHAQSGFARRTLVVAAAHGAQERRQQLEGLETTGLNIIALDEADCWIGDRQAEERLLVLYEEFKRRDGALLLASRGAPTELHFALPDCASRLRALQVFQLPPLLEEDCRTLLRRQARRRGLPLPRPVLDYWLRHRPRDAKSLMEDFEVLDRAIWERKQRLTLPLLKAVLDL